MKTPTPAETSALRQLARESPREPRSGPSVLAQPCNGDLEALDGILAFISNLLTQTDRCDAYGVPLLALSRGLRMSNDFMEACG